MIARIQFSLLYLVFSITIFVPLNELQSQTSKNAQGMPPGIRLKPKAGEEVQAYFLGEWRAAQIVEASRNQVMVDVAFGNGYQRRTVGLNEVRYPWQADAISPVYVWKDESGSFSVKAAVLDFDREARTVKLYNMEKNQEIVVPVDKLSDADKSRLKRIVGNAPLKIIPPPPIEQFQTIGLNQPAAWNTATDLTEVEADPPQVEVAISEGGAVFPKLGFWDNLLSVYPIGSSAGWMAAATGVDSSIGKEDFPGRLIWATLADGKVRKVQSIANGEILVAVDPTTQQVLTVGKNEGRESTLTVWSASPKTDKAKPVIRWLSHKDVFSGDPFAEFVSPDRVLHRWGDSQYVVWDFQRKAAAYEIKQESFFDAPPVLSPGKRYLALPEDKGVRIISAADGRTLATLPIEGGRTSAVAFDASGSKLAVLTNNQLAVWTLGSSDAPATYVASSVGSPFGQKLAWVDEQMLLVDGQILFDLGRELPIWRYQPAHSEVVRGSGFREVTKLASGRLCYGVELRERDQGAFVVGAVELPGAAVLQTVARVDENRLWTLGEGSTVRIETNCGSYDSQARSGLEAAARQCGWVIQANGQFLIKAEMGRSKSQTVTYQIMGRSDTESVTVTPYFSKVEVLDGQTSLWSAGSSSGGAPSFMWVKEGESIQSRVSETERPDPEFFQRVKLPGRILHPKFKQGFGTSVYSRLGLTATPLKDLPLLP